MAYNIKHIEAFINKVNAEADKEAQAVYEKHQAELQRMVENQVLKGQRLISGNGTVTIIDPNKELPYDYAEKFLDVLAQMSYNKIRAGFSCIEVDKINVGIN